MGISFLPLIYEPEKQDNQVSGDMNAILDKVTQFVSENPDLEDAAARAGASWLLRMAGAYCVYLKEPHGTSTT